jgi:hypothetical protein
MVLNIVVAFSLCNTKTYFDTGEPAGTHRAVQIIFFLQNADDCIAIFYWIFQFVAGFITTIGFGCVTHFYVLNAIRQSA